MKDSLTAGRQRAGTSLGSGTFMKRARKYAGGVLFYAFLIAIAGDTAALESTSPLRSKRREPVQHTAQAQPAQSEAPQRTTATYGDWVVQCETQAQEPHQKICEMGQVTQVQGKSIPFSRIALGHPVKGQPTRLVVQVPVNASFSANVSIQTGDADPGVAAPFARCMPSGCFAEFDLKDDVLRKFRAASGSGKISFLDAAGHNVTVPLSFHGFGEAYDGLSKE